MRALFLPLDNRPVTYVFPQFIARVAGVEPVAPPRELLGSLTDPAQIDQLCDWTKETLRTSSLDLLLLCLDSLLYGGLISSRRSFDTLEELMQRAALIQSLKAMAGNRPPVLAQSSIMRIADSYDASEEKDYWAQYGREIFSWSGYLHRISLGESVPRELVSDLESKIPEAIRDDYLQTRSRNFKVNRHLLDLVTQGSIDILMFSLDDSGEFGLNVLEKQRLMEEVQRKKIDNKVFAYAGADEVLCSLLARALGQAAGVVPKARVEFSPEGAGAVASRYEGQTIADSVTAQLQACGIARAAKDAPRVDFTVIVHGSSSKQGDHISLPGENLGTIDTTAAVKRTMKLIEQSEEPCVICDVAYANGSDPLLVDALLKRRDLFERIWSYAGWNTTGNTLGAALSLSVAQWYATDHADHDSRDALRQCLFVRLADDWAYQSQVRPSSGQDISQATLEKKMEPYLRQIKEALQWEPANLELSLPWQRSFEVEVLV